MTEGKRMSTQHGQGNGVDVDITRLQLVAVNGWLIAIYYQNVPLADAHMTLTF